MKNTLHIGIGSFIIIASIIAYFYTITPITVGEVDSYNYLTELDEETQRFENGDIIYIYTSDRDIYEVESLNSRQAVLRKTENSSYLLSIHSAYEESTGSIIKAAAVREHFDGSIPEIEGHRIIAEVEFKGDDYTFDTPSSSKFIYSKEIATPIEITHTEYMVLPIITGIFGFCYLFIVVVSIANQSDHAEYEQGYQKPRRGKRERY